MTQNRNGDQPWGAPQQPYGQPGPGQLPPGQAPYGTYSTPYQPQPTQPQFTQPVHPGHGWQAPQDPNQPFVQQQAPRVSIDDFKRPPQGRVGWLVAAVVAAAALLMWAVMHFTGAPVAPPTQSPEPLPPAASEASPVPTQPADPAAGSSVEFTNQTDDTEGTFTITSHEWTQQGLLLHVKVTLTKGEQRISFFALDNNTTRDFTPAAGAPDNLDGQSLGTGQTLTGTVLFEKEQGDTTVFLTDSRGRQVTALKVKG